MSDELDSDAVLQAADITMYRAKADGRARYATFDQRRNDSEVTRSTLSTTMPAAVECAEFFIDYQPDYQPLAGLADGVGRVHVLGNSLGARIALKLAQRNRALSVVSIAPSGLNVLPERIFQGVAMSTFRLLMCILHPAIGPLARFPAGRVALLTGLRSQLWLASEVEARAAGGVRRV